MNRLTKTDWIKHGFKTLLRGGFSELKAEPMAKALGVSRGSFYWHFKTISEFHQQLLECWQEQATELVIKTVNDNRQKPLRLADLMKRAFTNTTQSRLDFAIRNWAQFDASVRARLEKVDRMRLDYISALLVDTGVSQQTAAHRARLIYAASLGHELIADPDTFSQTDLEELANHMAGR